ncbi:hypothetical protein D3C72_2098890 [compost metagenome]
MRQIPHDQSAYVMRFKGVFRHVVDLSAAVIDMRQYHCRNFWSQPCKDLSRRHRNYHQIEQLGNLIDNVKICRESVRVRDDDLAIRTKPNSTD